MKHKIHDATLWFAIMLLGLAQMGIHREILDIRKTLDMRSHELSVLSARVDNCLGSKTIAIHMPSDPHDLVVDNTMRLDGAITGRTPDGRMWENRLDGDGWVWLNDEPTTFDLRTIEEREAIP